jgi:hypothetical protein
MLETDLIYLTFGIFHILEISLHEMQTPELSTGGWRLYLSRDDNEFSDTK